MILIGLLIIPLFIASVGFFVFKTTITWKEFLFQIAISTTIMVVGYLIARWSSLSDIEHLNGRITNKLSGSEKCCHCRQVCNGYREVCSGSGKNRTCSTQCTGYHEECDHYQDYWWSLDSTVGRIGIDSCEPNKHRVPKVWANAKVGEPATVTHTYTNYLKADPDSLIVHNKHEKFLDKIPSYPSIYEYYKVNPVISYGANIPNGWQEAFSEINADLGAKKQIDITVLLTNIQDPTYAQAVEAKWLYGPKNSLTVVIGVREGLAEWARVVTISRVEALKIELRDTIQGKRVEGIEIPNIIRSGVLSGFKRKPMSDFEYLASTAEPSALATIILYIIGIILSIGLGIFMHTNELFNEGKS